jgi:hypothetical protein
MTVERSRGRFMGNVTRNSLILVVREVREPSTRHYEFGPRAKSLAIKSVVVCQFGRAPVLSAFFSADFVSAGTKSDTVVVPAG